MKKILLFFTLTVILQIPVYSSVYVEGNGMFGSFGDAGSTAVFGGGIGTNVMPMFNAYLKLQSGSSSQVSGGIETSYYKQMSFFTEGEYMYRIGKLPLLWCSGADIGMTRLEMWDGAYKLSGKKDSKKMNGLYTSFNTGIRYHLSQHIGIYSRIGYHSSKWLWRENVNDPVVAGIAVQVGITATFFGKNTTIDEEY